MNRATKIQVAISAVSIVVIGVHLIWPNVSIDTTTLTLLIVAIVPWLAPLFKSLEIPGGLKFEFQELEKTKQEAEAAGLIEKTPPTKFEREYEFLNIAESNPSLALAGLRMELEKVLRLLAEQSELLHDNRFAGVALLMNLLYRENIISNVERAALADMVGTLNRAVHGQETDPRVTQWIIDVGPKILDGLYKRISK